MHFKVKKFEDLDIHQLYEILQLRSEVFVVEQDCVYQDIDGKDQKALHIIGIKESKIIAYTRAFKAGDYFEEASFGRVVISKDQRQYGYGHDLVKATVKAIEEHFKESTIKISAQTHLEKFYGLHGFVQTGKGYLEDGIPHIGMIKTKR